MPIVAMTANVLPHQVAAFRDCGMQGHIGKPFKRQQPYATIDRFARARTTCEGDMDHDRDTFDDLAQTTGRDTTNRLLASFAGELGRRFGEDGTMPDRVTLAKDAHAVVGAASMLGFSSLAALCREAETTSAPDLADLTRRLHAMRRDTLAMIDQLTAA